MLPRSRHDPSVGHDASTQRLETLCGFTAADLDDDTPTFHCAHCWQPQPEHALTHDAAGLLVCAPPCQPIPCDYCEEPIGDTDVVRAWTGPARSQRTLHHFCSARCDAAHQTRAAVFTDQAAAAWRMWHDVGRETRRTWA